MSICLVCVWLVGFFAKAFAPWFSSNITVDSFFSYPNLFSSQHNQTVSCVAELSAKYSASVDYSVIVFWCLLCQLTTAPANLKRYPEVDF